MITCIAIDDEPLSLAIIQTFCESINDIQLLGKFTDVSKASAFIETHPVQMIFLDVQMPDMNGFDFYKKYGKGKMVVFTTAHSEYAFEGFNVQAIDFLVKPFDKIRFEVACKKAQDFLKLKSITGEPEPEYVTIKSDYKYNLVNIKDIIYVESRDDYVKFILKDNKFILSKMTTKLTQEMLPNHSFMRVHRSFIVNTQLMTHISSSDVTVAGIKIPLGKKYKEEVMATLK